MSKTPFLYKFAEKLNECDIETPESHFDKTQQCNLFEDGTLCWNGVTRKYYTNVYTPGHTIPAHRSPSTNKMIPARVVKGKYDRRVNH